MSETNPGSGAPSDERDEIHLLEYWRVLVARRNVVFVTLGAVVVLTGVFTLLATPKYEATTTLQISRQGPEVTNFKDVMGVDPAGYQDFYQTQFRIIQSRSVIRLAVERLDLPHRPEFVSRKGSPIGRMVKWLRGLVSGEAAEVDPLAPAIKFIEEGIGVSPVRNSQLVKISFTDRDAEFAAEIANAVSFAYQQFNLQAKRSTTNEANEFLTKEVERIRVEVAEARSRLQELSTKKEILSVGDLKDISEQALGELNTRLTEAKGRFALAEAKWRSVQNVRPDGLPEVMNSPLIARLKEAYAEAERNHAELSKRFKPEWPALQSAQQALDQAKDRLHIEVDAIASQVRQNARTDYDRATAEVASLTEQVDRQKTEVQRVNRENIEYTSLKTEIDTKSKVLNDLFARQSETRTTARLRETQSSNILVVDVAEAPKKPISPKKTINMLLALFVGTGLGIGLAFLLDYLDNTVKDENDVARLAGIPVLGHVPLYQPLRAVPVDGSPVSALDPLDVASHLEPKSLFAEAFKNLRTSFLLASAERPPTKVVVTSFEPSDGKSTVCLNLAIVLTQAGKRILLVDADLRRPRVHKMLRLDNRQGLSSILSGNAQPEDCLQETAIPNLMCIPSGPIPPNPSELLGSASLDHFLAWAEHEGGFDHVFVDSPPSLQVTDGVILSSKTDATIIVVRGGKTARESLVQGVARVKTSRGHVAGAVLNAVTEGQGYYYGKYGYYRRYEEDSAAGATAEASGPRRAKSRRA